MALHAAFLHRVGLSIIKMLPASFECGRVAEGVTVSFSLVSYFSYDRGGYIYASWRQQRHKPLRGSKSERSQVRSSTCVRGPSFGPPRLLRFARRAGPIQEAGRACTATLAVGSRWVRNSFPGLVFRTNTSKIKSRLGGSLLRTYGSIQAAGSCLYH